MDQQMAYRHLIKDKTLQSVIRTTGKFAPLPRKDLFNSLLHAIVSQQLSTKAAATIWERFILLFPLHTPDADGLLALTEEQLRSVGLSYQKAGYLKNIALFSKENSLSYKSLYRKSDEELIAHLCVIKGVGRWTAEMILLFSLQRQDVFPVDDLGVQQAMQQLYTLTTKGKKLREEMETIATNWKPYRSLAVRHLWAWKDAIDTIHLAALE